MAVFLGATFATFPAEAAPDFVVTTPVFFFQVAGFAGDNPTLVLQAGQTYEFQIQTMAMHPFGFTTQPGSLVPFTDGVVGTQPTNDGTLFFTPPVTGADYMLFYTCPLHLFSGTIEVEQPASGDADGDLVPDAADNCAFTANPAQTDTGGVGSGSVADGIGDACQCGDVSGDGRVTIADATAIVRSLLQPPTATLTSPELCDVGGAPTPTNDVCTISDAVLIRRALLQPPTAAIQPLCPPAQP
jgi:hypothetical protein